MATKCPKGFKLVTDECWDLQYREPVFNPITNPNNSAVAPVNRALKQLGAYIRLYYHMIWIYREYIDENPDFKETIYDVENLRREIQAKIDEHGGPLDNDLRVQLTTDAHTILSVGGQIIEIYEKARDWCLSREIPSKAERLRRIYNIIDVEQELFIGYPETRYAHNESGKKYLQAVFGNKQPSASDKEILDHLKRVVENSIPPNSTMPIIPT